MYLDLLDPRLTREFMANPDQIREHIPRRDGSTTVIVDEIQRVPQLLSVIHALLEEPNPPKFIMTGSSARKLRRQNVDLLGGRAVLRAFHPFMAAELPSFQLDEALVSGTLPLIVAAQDPVDVLNSYINLYVDEEVRTEALTRNVERFIRFLEGVSFSHASLLNVSNVARECHVPRNVVESYVAILLDLLLAYQVPVFARRAKRKLVAHSKFYLFDAGIFRTLRPTGPLDRPSEIEGAALEGLVSQNLKAWTDYRKGDSKLYFWRTRAGSEIDFIVYGRENFVAIEVKNSDRITSQDVRALNAFVSDYPQASPVLLYRGEAPLEVRGVLCLPVGMFLRSLAPHESLDSVIESCVN